MTGPCFIGVDGGTESLRVGVFDASGTPLGTAASAYPTAFPRPGWAEQRPADWWRALTDALPRALADAGAAPERVAGMAVDTTCCSVVALGPDGEALRPALIWMDVRAGAQAERILATGDAALRVNGAGHGPLSAEWMLPKALWLLENEPETFERARTICEYQDYLNLRLTGKLAASLDNASIRWHYSSRRERPGGGRGAYASSLMRAAGLDGLEARLPARVVPMGEPVGELTRAAAAELGLPAGLPVVQGGADAFVAMLGLGVVAPGSLAFITGSSHLHLGLAEAPLHARGVWGTYADAVVPGLHAVEGGQSSTGSVVAWLRRLLPEATDYDVLNERAAALPPGAEGLLLLEHFQGNRSPHTDPDARGVITGLTLRHREEHLFRAVLEGVAFGTELIFETFRGAGFAPSDVVVAGGATRSELWLQIHADVSGLPLALTRVPDAPLLGSALLAAVGTGHHGDLAGAAAAMVARERVIEPDEERHEAYREIYALYRELYPTLSPLLHRQVARAKRSEPDPDAEPDAEPDAGEEAPMT